MPGSSSRHPLASAASSSPASAGAPRFAAASSGRSARTIWNTSPSRMDLRISGWVLSSSTQMSHAERLSPLAKLPVTCTAGSAARTPLTSSGNRSGAVEIRVRLPL